MSDPFGFTGWGSALPTQGNGAAPPAHQQQQQQPAVVSYPIVLPGVPN